MSEYLEIHLSSQWMLYLLPMSGFILGVVFSRRRIKKQKKQLRFSNDYFQGLNYLLNDQQDKALDIFVQLVETDWETIDTSLALGAIFRRQGEIDKAIKLHQNLLARPSLPLEYKSTVLISLAKDYLQAGWLDRAESLFKEVVADEEFTQEAQKCLMSIYEQEQEWNNAINIARRFQRRGDTELSAVIAQYYCELSQQALQQNDLKEAEALATQALTADKNCVRASIILADLAMGRGRYQKAIRFLRQVEMQDIQLFSLVTEKLIQCYRNISSLNKALSYLRALDKKYPEVILVSAIADLIEEIYGREEAMQYVSDAALHQPSLISLSTLIHMQHSGVSHDNFVLTDTLDGVVARQYEYQCSRCGYSANTYVWLCPSCHNWSSLLSKTD
ncbi:Lipopolysaccharide assembly protein LapB [hydrothermal vent metagenome]|uniref:Lipopolysaccharide assembly protein LapB n=1 Tax=hydrothermal vent metagenome TaxID=652676 RepID=A0A3B0XPD5_9ZZZZ